MNVLETIADATITGGIGQILEDVFGWISELFTSVVGLFYNSTTGFTFPGVMLLVAFGLSMVWVVINFIKGLVKRG